MSFKKGTKRAEISNAIDVNGIVGKDMPMNQFSVTFEKVSEFLTEKERVKWCNKLTGVCLGSDAFFSFHDNFDRAKLSGVSFIESAAGSTNDAGVIEACNEHGIVMAHTNLRLFHH